MIQSELYCLDTHTQYWQLTDRGRLSSPVRDVFNAVQANRLNAPIVTCDASIQASPQVRCIW
jgi:PIN domain nuclease of toxin-antitoxin system